MTRDRIRRLYTERKPVVEIANITRTDINIVRQVLGFGPSAEIPQGFEIVPLNRTRSGSYVRVYPKRGILISSAAVQAWQPETLFMLLAENIDRGHLVMVPSEKGQIKLTWKEGVCLHNNATDLHKAFKRLGATDGRYYAWVQNGNLYVDCSGRVG